MGEYENELAQFKLDKKNHEKEIDDANKLIL
jgi:hypothetical protein